MHPALREKLAKESSGASLAEGVNWENVVEPLFKLFLSFLYSGNYEEYGLEVLTEMPDSDTANEVQAEDLEAISDLSNPNSGNEDEHLPGSDTEMEIQPVGSYDAAECAAQHMSADSEYGGQQTAASSSMFAQEHLHIAPHSLWSFVTGMQEGKELPVRPISLYPKTQRRSKRRAIRKFSELQPAIHGSKVSDWQPEESAGRTVSYREVFLDHAELYHLAGLYGIDTLRHLALHRLHRTLFMCRVGTTCISDLIPLIEEVYKKTKEGDLAREIVSTYCWCIRGDLNGNEEFEAVRRVFSDFDLDLGIASYCSLK